MKLEKIKKFIPIIGLALFVYLIIKLKVIEIIQQVSEIKLNYFLIAMCFVLVYLVFQTLKWFMIARKQGIRVPFKEAFKINVISDFYGFVTPGKIGSVIRADYLKKYEGGIGRGLSNFMIDKILDLTSLFTLAIFFGFIFYNKTKIVSKEVLYFIIAIFAIMVLFSLIFYKKKYSKRILRFFYRKFIPESKKEKARLAFESFYENMPRLSFLIPIFLINIASWIITYGTSYFVGKSLGIELKFIFFLCVLPIATIIAQIPITISGLGTRELTMMKLFGILGVAEVKVFSMSILTILIANIIPSIIAMFVLYLGKNKDKNDIHENLTSQ